MTFEIERDTYVMVSWRQLIYHAQFKIPHHRTNVSINLSFMEASIHLQLAKSKAPSMLITMQI